MNTVLKKKEDFSPHKRSRARRLAAQALYQWQLTEQEITEIDRQFCESRDMQGADLEYFHELLKEVTDNINALDGLLRPVLDRKLEELDPVEQAILRISVYELSYRGDVPCRVIINEAVALTKKFGAEQSYTYVNGVLDRIARSLRAKEFTGS